MYVEDELVALSALQHVVFCERQCALIHVEQAWRENRYTAEGRVMHDRAHSHRGESRAGVRTVFAMPIRSLNLGVAGVADVVEFRDDGSPYPVEYKRGRRKSKLMDEVQLCAQALCLEEMLGAVVREGALFYGKERRRKVIEFTEDLRHVTREAAERVHEIVDRGTTPRAVYTALCRRCSLIDACMPKLLSRSRRVEDYVHRMMIADIGTEDEG